MAANKSVWGIDLGQCALKAIRLQATESGVEVVDHVYFEHAKILSQPEVDRAALIDEAMKKFLEGRDLTRDTLVVGVPGQHTLARFTKLPPVDKKKIPEIVRYEAQQQIPFDMDEVIWDYQVFTNAETNETEVGIFAMRRELLRNHLHFVSSFNLEPAAVQSNPLALYCALKYDGLTGKEAVAIIDIGTQNTDLIVADGESLWTRNIPIGGNNFTEALLKTFKLSFRKAENLKRDAAKSKYARQIFQAMRPVFADLVAEVQRSIGFFTSSRRGVKLSKIIAMGSAFKLPGLTKFLQQNLGMDVVRPSTFSKLSTANAPNVGQLTEQLMSFGVAYGLALQGLGQAAITSNLLPPEIAKQVIWRRKTPWFYGAAACLVLSAAIVWGRTMSDEGVIAAAEAGGSSAQNPPVDPQNPAVDPQMMEIVTNGPKGSTPLARARSVINAQQNFSSVLQTLEGMNSAAIANAQKIADLHAKKAVWPTLLHMLHAALPRDAALDDAMRKGADAYEQLIKSKPELYARAKRKQVFIANFQTQFSLDVLKEFAALKLSKKAGVGTGAPASPPSPLSPYGGETTDLKPGFIFTLTGRTPNARGWDFLKETLYANLLKASSKEGYVNDVFLVDCWKASKDREADRNRGPQMFSRGSAEKVQTRTDPVTGESMMDDYEFEMIVAVVLGPKPAANPGGADLGTGG